jgi:hypothetical protein
LTRLVNGRWPPADVRGVRLHRGGSRVRTLASSSTCRGS